MLCLPSSIQWLRSKMGVGWLHAAGSWQYNDDTAATAVLNVVTDVPENGPGCARSTITPSPASLSRTRTHTRTHAHPRPVNMASPCSSEANILNRSSRANKTLYSLPVHCLTEADIVASQTKGMLHHFHAPTNAHDRFLTSLTAEERAILPHFERPPEYSHGAVAEPKQEWRPSVRPGTAPAGAGQAAVSSSSGGGSTRRQPAFSTQAPAHPAAAASALQQRGSTRLQASAPCSCNTGSCAMLVDVDLLTGEPASAHLCSTQPWRVAWSGREQGRVAAVASVAALGLVASTHSCSTSRSALGTSFKALRAEVP